MKLNQMMWYEGAKRSWTKMQAYCQHSSRKIKSWNGLHSRQPSCTHSLFIIWVNRMDQGRFLLCKQVHIKVRKAHVNDQKEISKMERPWSFPCKQTRAGFSPLFLKIGEPPDTILTSSHEDEETLNLPFTPKACLHIPTLKKQNPIVQKTTFVAA